MRKCIDPGPASLLELTGHEIDMLHSLLTTWQGDVEEDVFEYLLLQIVERLNRCRIALRILGASCEETDRSRLERCRGGFADAQITAESLFLEHKEEIVALFGSSGGFQQRLEELAFQLKQYLRLVEDAILFDNADWLATDLSDTGETFLETLTLVAWLAYHPPTIVEEAASFQDWRQRFISFLDYFKKHFAAFSYIRSYLDARAADTLLDEQFWWIKEKPEDEYTPLPECSDEILMDLLQQQDKKEHNVPLVIAAAMGDPISDSAREQVQRLILESDYYNRLYLDTKASMHEVGATEKLQRDLGGIAAYYLVEAGRELAVSVLCNLSKINEYLGHAGEVFAIPIRPLLSIEPDPQSLPAGCDSSGNNLSPARIVEISDGRVQSIKFAPIRLDVFRPDMDPCLLKGEVANYAVPSDAVWIWTWSVPGRPPLSPETQQEAGSNFELIFRFSKQSPADTRPDLLILVSNCKCREKHDL